MWILLEQCRLSAILSVRNCGVSQDAIILTSKSNIINHDSGGKICPGSKRSNILVIISSCYLRITLPLLNSWSLHFSN